MNIKTSELTGAAFDWAVAVAMGWKWKMDGKKIILARPAKRPNKRRPFDTLGLAYFHPAKSWSIAGPIIEREQISLGDNCPQGWEASRRKGVFAVRGFGPTPLVAAMRCYVASKLGDDVEIPAELL